MFFPEQLETRQELASFIRGKKEELELEERHLQMFEAAQMTAKHVRRARSVEILVKSYLDKTSKGSSNEYRQSTLFCYSWQVLLAAITI